MPKTLIELPRSIEVKDIRIDTKTNTILIDHRVLRGQASSPTVYLTCTGDGGQESQAIVYLSLNTGQYRVRNVGSEGAAKFDLPPEDARARRPATRKQPVAVDEEVPMPQPVKDE